MRPFPIALTLLWLTGCGSEPDAPAPAVQPSGYLIRAADIWGSSPQDLCRARDGEFLQKLISRVRAKLPPEAQASFKFQEFDTWGLSQPAGAEAMLRFTAKIGDEDDTRLAALGPFDPTSCEVGPLQIGKGFDPHDPKWKKIGGPA